jgi:hypothetical protein
MQLAVAYQAGLELLVWAADAPYLLRLQELGVHAVGVDDVPGAVAQLSARRGP